MTYHPHSVFHRLARAIRTGNEGTEQLFIKNVLGASDIPKNHYVSSYSLKKKVSRTWQQAKAFIMKCSTCFCTTKLHYTLEVTPRAPTKVNKNEIWQIDVFLIAEFGKLRLAPHHWHILRLPMGKCFEFWKGWFWNHTFTERNGSCGNRCTNQVWQCPCLYLQ